MRLGFFVTTLMGALALVAQTSCSNGTSSGFRDDPYEDGGQGGDGGATSDGGIPIGAGVGESCSETDDCRPGLACEADVCEPGRSTPEGDPCVISGECADGLSCINGSCGASGEGELGASCAGDEDCATGLRCGLVGFGAQCVVEGTGDVGGTCTTSSDCFGGLLCSGEAGCAPVPPGAPVFGFPVFPSITCAEESDGDVVAHFEVPGADGADPEADFFRLPFPNDVRIRSGGLNLSGFPTPGVSPLVGFDPVQLYVDAISDSESAWGTYPTVLFRFSGRVDFDSLRFEGGLDPVRWIDVTDPDDPQNAGLSWGGSTQAGKYVCHNWIGVRRNDGAPLEPGHTYAVFVTMDARARDGSAIRRDDHFESMLDDDAPSDSALAAAHAAYAPFRAYLDAQSIARSSILTASVITTSPVRDPMGELASAVRAVPAPALSDWVHCDGAKASPCPQAEGDRACGEGTEDYDEYHALVRLPIFQRGEAPYFDSGGGIDASGPEREEEVCVALTVPKGDMPAAGYPLVVFGHGTGGSFRSHVNEGIAGALARATTASGTPVPMAVLGYDAVQHGPRRGDSMESPNNLFFNFANPDAARGNPLQGGADVIGVGRAAAVLDVAATETGGSAIRIDPAKIVYFGHSQGSMHGSLGLPYSSEYQGAVLSGNGASLMHALLEKRAPVNISAAVPLLLGDFGEDGLFGGDLHPVLTLVSQWIDPADPLNFGRVIAHEPEIGIPPKHVFQTYGLGDTYSPPVTMRTYAFAAGLTAVEADTSATDPDDLGSEQPAPFSGNVTVDARTLTLAVRQYGPPEDSDGHFVAFDVANANADVVRFLADAANGDVPVVGE